MASGCGLIHQRRANWLVELVASFSPGYINVTFDLCKEGIPSPGQDGSESCREVFNDVLYPYTITSYLKSISTLPNYKPHNPA